MPKQTKRQMIRNVKKNNGFSVDKVAESYLEVREKLSNAQNALDSWANAGMTIAAELYLIHPDSELFEKCFDENTREKIIKLSKEQAEEFPFSKVSLHFCKDTVLENGVESIINIIHPDQDFDKVNTIQKIKHFAKIHLDRRGKHEQGTKQAQSIPVSESELKQHEDTNI